MGTELRRKGSYKLVLCPCIAKNDGVVVVLGRVEVGKEGDEGADRGPIELFGKMEPLLLLGAPLLVNPEAGVVVYMVPVVWK
jgi:hypothetical protein